MGEMMDKSSEAFLDAVGAARSLLGITMQDLADSCGTSKGHIHGLLNKRHEPKLGIAIKLANELNLSLDNY